jgi:CitMHS family citrate-Mg2+:H+ or citrate-Ca2+:H+ symporter
MSMFSYAELILGVMVVVYVLARVFTPSTELSMLAAAIAGALAGGFGFPYRHIAEETYIDINLSSSPQPLHEHPEESGGVAFAVGPSSGIPQQPAAASALADLSSFRRFDGSRQRDSVVGGVIAAVLHYMRIAKLDLCHHFFDCGAGAAAPPVSLWAMRPQPASTCYAGFFWPLAFPCVVAAILTIFILGWKGTQPDIIRPWQNFPNRRRDELVQVLLPFAIFLG